MNQLRGRFIIGITGTPRYQSASDVCQMAKYLKIELPQSNAACESFLKKFVRRNEPNLNLPPLIEKHIWVELTPEERAIYLTLHGSDALMSCNHHQLAMEVLDLLDNEKEMTIGEVVNAVQKGREKRIADMELMMNKHLKQLEKVQSSLNELTGFDTPQILTNELQSKMNQHVIEEVTSLQSRYQSIRTAIQSVINDISAARSQFNFFQQVLESLKKKESKSCIICLEEIMEYSIARCGHVYCTNCATLLIKSPQPKCSMCREPLTTNDLMRIKVPSGNDEIEDPDLQNRRPVADASDLSRFGSKLASFVSFMRDTLKEQPDAKFILFIQFKRLMYLVNEALNELGVENVQCTGNVMTKSRAVRLFKSSDKVRLILLSSEDTVSGLHLTNATHMIIFHPFDGPDAIANEKQGIARAWRSGLDHPVQLIRFITRNSIEEQLAIQRHYQEGQHLS